jgi:hypothetical protein
MPMMGACGSGQSNCDLLIISHFAGEKKCVYLMDLISLSTCFETGIEISVKYSHIDVLHIPSHWYIPQISVANHTIGVCKPNKLLKPHGFLFVDFLVRLKAGHGNV